jgi:hypothetical protein
MVARPQVKLTAGLSSRECAISPRGVRSRGARARSTLSRSSFARTSRSIRGGALFVFASKRSNRLNVMWFDHHGYCILYKRLHDALFELPDATASDRPFASIDARTLAALVRGVAKVLASPPNLPSAGRSTGRVRHCGSGAAPTRRRHSPTQRARGSLAPIRGKPRIHAEASKFHAAPSVFPRVHTSATARFYAG